MANRYEQPRTPAALLELLAGRVKEYRDILRNIDVAIRPDHCLGCRIVQQLLRNADHSA